MDEIIIHDSKLVGRRLTSRVSVPKNLKKYFKTQTFFANYDSDIHANKSVLNIPLLSAILPLAWLTRHDVVVGELDMEFNASMHELQQEFNKMYPKMQINTKIIPDVLVENRIKALDPAVNTALLFSGGIDSTYSLLTNIELKPKLIMIWGIDYYPYPKYSEHWRKVISTYSNFARRLGLTIHFIKTNIGDLLQILRIEHDFHDLLYDGGFRARLQHSLVLLPLVAPLSIGRFDHLIIAASCSSQQPYNRAPHARATQPCTDEKIVWADTQIKHDGYISRVKKTTGTIKDYLRNNKLTLCVCNRREPEHNKLNCSSCEKCLRTIAPLVMVGIDPNECGFEVDESTFHSMKHMLTKIRLTFDMREAEWEPIQKIVPEKIHYDKYGSKAFFEWFRDIDLKTYDRNVWIYRDVYNKLPYTISRILDILYRRMGIDIHDTCPLRPSKRATETNHICKNS